MRLISSLKRVLWTCIWKELKEKLKLVSQSVLLVQSYHVWLNCVNQFKYKSLCISCIKMNGFLLILLVLVTKSIRVLEKLSTWRLLNLCLSPNQLHIQVRSSHFSMKHVTTLHKNLIKYIPFEVRIRPPQLDKSIVFSKKLHHS